MTRVVVDCSVVMAWCFEDEADAYADGILASLASGEAVVPGLWLLEVANVLIVAERRRRLTAADSARFLGFLEQLPIEVDASYPARGDHAPLLIAREYGLSAYDAAYLGLAMREGLPLATRDRALRAACRKSGVRVAEA
ncbi:MAG: type II toxin-antitoxin system VapC family toxin [Deltaproteobacteria bacterium]|nr:type II toxin-antitoxin system VapC family toxin [Deltaproteobacteria bacterium]